MFRALHMYGISLRRSFKVRWYGLLCSTWGYWMVAPCLKSHHDPELEFRTHSWTYSMQILVMSDLWPISNRKTTDWRSNWYSDVGGEEASKPPFPNCSQQRSCGLVVVPPLCMQKVPGSVPQCLQLKRIQWVEDDAKDHGLWLWRESLTAGQNRQYWAW